MIAKSELERELELKQKTIRPKLKKRALEQGRVLMTNQPR